jgi:hypothetical protein
VKKKIVMLFKSWEIKEVLIAYDMIKEIRNEIVGFL